MKTIVIGVIGADVHAVGNKIIEYVLKNEGYNVSVIWEQDINEDNFCSLSQDLDYLEKQLKENNLPSGWGWKTLNCIYEGDELPSDYICPICKHGAIDFEKIFLKNRKNFQKSVDKRIVL